MKRLILLCMMMLLVGMNVASAKMGNQIDKFTEDVEYFSFYANEKGHSSVLYSKILSNTPIYNIEFCIAYEVMEYYGKGVDVKVDKDLNFLAFIEKSSADERKFYNQYVLKGKIRVPEELVEKMVNAERVAFKVYYENSPADIVVIPKEILEEWKEVSRKEK